MRTDTDFGASHTVSTIRSSAGRQNKPNTMCAHTQRLSASIFLQNLSWWQRRADDYSVVCTLDGDKVPSVRCRQQFCLCTVAVTCTSWCHMTYLARSWRHHQKKPGFARAPASATYTTLGRSCQQVACCSTLWQLLARPKHPGKEFWDRDYIDCHAQQPTKTRLSVLQ